MSAIRKQLEAARDQHQKLTDCLDIIDHHWDVPGCVTDALTATSRTLQLIIIAVEKIETRLFIAEGK